MENGEEQRGGHNRRQDYHFIIQKAYYWNEETTSRNHRIHLMPIPLCRIIVSNVNPRVWQNQLLVHYMHKRECI
jgi:hypothetical protein